MENIALPPELSSSVSSESKDFAVKAGRAQPLKKMILLQRQQDTTLRNSVYAAQLKPPHMTQ